MPIALGAAVLGTAMAALAIWPGFYPKEILVSGNHRVTRGEILARAEIAPEVSIWLQNTSAIAKRVEAIPFISTAGVARIVPASIRITVAERVPFAIVRSGDESAVVDRQLRVLQPILDQDEDPTLVLQPGLDLEPGAFVRSADAIELRDAYEAISARQIEVTKLELDRFGGLVVTMRGGLRLLLGDGDLGRKLTLADAILTQIVSRKGRIAAVDLRAPSAPVLVYR
jgi:cell division septal protein FtsQ